MMEIQKRRVDIANRLGQEISKNSSSKDYSTKFQEKAEKEQLDFNTVNSEMHKIQFAITELCDVLKNCHDTAIGPDEIYYQLLKHLP